MEKCIGCDSKEIVLFGKGRKIKCNYKDVPEQRGINNIMPGNGELEFASHKYLCEKCGLVMEELDKQSLEKYNEYKNYIQS